MSDNSKIIGITTKVQDIFPKDQFSIQINNSNKFSIKTGKDNCLQILIKGSLLYISFLHLFSFETPKFSANHIDICFWDYIAWNVMK